jgi:hypothetical protein
MNAKYADVVSEQEVLAYIAARKEKTIATDRGSEVKTTGWMGTP